MLFVLISTTLLVLLTIGTGVFMMYRQVEGGRKKLKKSLRTNLFVFLPVLVMAVVIMVPEAINAAEEGLTGSATGMGFIAAALSTGLAAIGGGYAVGVVGSAALGAVSEDETILGKTLIFVGLAEGIAIYGLIVSIMILGRL